MFILLILNDYYHIKINVEMADFTSFLLILAECYSGWGEDLSVDVDRGGSGR